MSFYVDPWLFNCRNNPADSRAQRLAQRTTIAATTRALAYARRHGVTLVASLGNEHTNLDAPTLDLTSPDYPPNSEHRRKVDNTCLVLPTEGPGVFSVGAVGPSGTKADYSNYGLEQTEVVAPGGYLRDRLGTPGYRSLGNLVLSAYPRAVAEANGDIGPDGASTTPYVVRDCRESTCAYYQYLQGTSMAAPHVTGVAALVVSRFGTADPVHGGLTLAPATVEAILRRTAAPHPCPKPARLDYTRVERPASWNALCRVAGGRNSLYGRGVVDALAAVQ